MPKVTNSQDAIRRALKVKFKLVLSENKHLVYTINSYVRQAEKIWRETESKKVITPARFALVMGRLETTYSACIKLILIANDLFEREIRDYSAEKDNEDYSSMSDTELSLPCHVPTTSYKTEKRIEDLERQFRALQKADTAGNHEPKGAYGGQPFQYSRGAGNGEEGNDRTAELQKILVELLNSKCSPYQHRKENSYVSDGIRESLASFLNPKHLGKLASASSVPQTDLVLDKLNRLEAAVSHLTQTKPSASGEINIAEGIREIERLIRQIESQEEDLNVSNLYRVLGNWKKRRVMFKKGKTKSPSPVSSPLKSYDGDWTVASISPNAEVIWEGNKDGRIVYRDKPAFLATSPNSKKYESTQKTLPEKTIVLANNSQTQAQNQTNVQNKELHDSRDGEITTPPSTQEPQKKLESQQVQSLRQDVLPKQQQQQQQEQQQQPLYLDQTLHKQQLQQQQQQQKQSTDQQQIQGLSSHRQQQPQCTDQSQNKQQPQQSGQNDYILQHWQQKQPQKRLEKSENQHQQLRQQQLVHGFRQEQQGPEKQQRKPASSQQYRSRSTDYRSTSMLPTRSAQHDILPVHMQSPIRTHYIDLESKTSPTMTLRHNRWNGKKSPIKQASPVIPKHLRKVSEFLPTKSTRNAKFPSQLYRRGSDYFRRSPEYNRFSTHPYQAQRGYAVKKRPIENGHFSPQNERGTFGYPSSYQCSFKTLNDLALHQQREATVYNRGQEFKGVLPYEQFESKSPVINNGIPVMKDGTHSHSPETYFPQISPLMETQEGITHYPCPHKSWEHFETERWQLMAETSSNQESDSDDDSEICQELECQYQMDDAQKKTCAGKENLDQTFGMTPIGLETYQQENSDDKKSSNLDAPDVNKHLVFDHREHEETQARPMFSFRSQLETNDIEKRQIQQHQQQQQQQQQQQYFRCQPLQQKNSYTSCLPPQLKSRMPKKTKTPRNGTSSFPENPQHYVSEDQCIDTDYVTPATDSVNATGYTSAQRNNVPVTTKPVEPIRSSNMTPFSPGYFRRQSSSEPPSPNFLRHERPDTPNLILKQTLTKEKSTFAETGNGQISPKFALPENKHQNKIVQIECTANQAAETCHLNGQLQHMTSVPNQFQCPVNNQPYATTPNVDGGVHQQGAPHNHYPKSRTQPYSKAFNIQGTQQSPSPKSQTSPVMTSQYLSAGDTRADIFSPVEIGHSPLINKFEKTLLQVPLVPENGHLSTTITPNQQTPLIYSAYYEKSPDLTHTFTEESRSCSYPIHHSENVETSPNAAFVRCLPPCSYANEKSVDSVRIQRTRPPAECPPYKEPSPDITRTLGPQSPGSRINEESAGLVNTCPSDSEFSPKPVSEQFDTTQVSPRFCPKQLKLLSEKVSLAGTGPPDTKCSTVNYTPCQVKPSQPLSPAYAHGQKVTSKEMELSPQILCLSNLPLKTTERDVLDLASHYGTVTKIFVIKQKSTGQFQGTSYVKFSNEAEAAMAQNSLQGKVWNGQPIFAEIYQNQVRKLQ